MNYHTIRYEQKKSIILHENIIKMTNIIFNKHIDQRDFDSLFNHSKTPINSNSTNKNRNNHEIDIKENLIKERELIINDIAENLKKNQSRVNDLSLLNHIETHPHFANLIALFEKEINPIKALALINLSYSSSNTGYEGWSMTEAAKLYSAIFDVIRSKGGVFCQDISPDVCASVDQLKNDLGLNVNKIKSIACEIMGGIINLKIGESYCMEGGWFNIPSGHTMIYRFKRTSKSQFDIYIYDAQNGSENQKGGKKEIRRNRSHPYIKLEGVTQKEMFFGEVAGQGTLFLENLLYLNVPISNQKKYSSSDVLACFSHIMHHFVTTKSVPSLFISTQRSGNCVVKSMNCLTLDLIGDPNQYKKTSLDLRLLTIAATYLAFKKATKNPVERDTRVFQLKEACSNFLRILNANFKRPDLAIDSDAYTIACATVFNILQELARLS